MKIENPACFLEDRNVVVIGSDLARLTAVTSQITAQNAQLRRDLRDLEGRLAERLRAVADSLRKSGLSNGEIARELTREREKFEKQLEEKARRTAEVGPADRPPLQGKRQSDAGAGSIMKRFTPTCETTSIRGSNTTCRLGSTRAWR